MIGGPPPTDLTLVRVLDVWEPPQNPHCSNCFHAKVSGPADRPLVRCAQGQGRRTERSLASLLRRGGYGFRSARDCEFYSSMSDDR